MKLAPLLPPKNLRAVYAGEKNAPGGGALKTRK